jgi:hypothetical protein
MRTKRVPINISKIEKYYRIDEDGAVFSLIKGRYLKPSRNGADYLQVFLKMYLGGVWLRLHRLVYFKYVKECPDHLEVAHKDGNKNNCHWKNLEAVSHGRNCRDSYRLHHRVHPIGMTHPHSWETKQIMAEKKKKAIVDNDKVRYKSIEEAAKQNGVNRRSVARSLYDNRMLRCGKQFYFC